jgi:hypothetical protein
MSDQAERVDQTHAELKGKRPRRGEQRRNRGQKPPKYGNKPRPQAAKKSAPKFLYLCKCHGERATKSPCERSGDDRQEGKFSQSPLGTWRCSVTRRKCKVERRMPLPLKEVSSNESTN